MKKVLSSISALLIISTITAFTGEESFYEGNEVSYHVVRGSREVYININLNPSKFLEIKVERSDNPMQYFRQIKAFGSENLDKLKGSDVIVNKYQLSFQSESYYKIVTIDKSGVQRAYPSVRL